MLHGGDIYTDGILKGRELLDYSSNINPLGVPQSFIEHIGEGIEALTRYPDIQYRELRKNLKEYIDRQYCEEDCEGWKAKEEYFILGNGAAEVIDLAISECKSIVIPVPSFIEYELDALKWHCNIQYSSLKEDMSYDYEDIRSKLQFSDGVILGNPNNPNGQTLDHGELEKILDFCEKNKKLVLIDEAFIEFTGEAKESTYGFIKRYSCIFIIRAVTKFFALPGIRFGYGISRNEELLERIRKKQNPWNVNCFAELAVRHILKDKKYIEASLEWISKERKEFLRNLMELKIVKKVYETKSNYVLVQLQYLNCHELYDFCLKEGIVIRKAHSFKGLNDKFIRLAIKDREKNNQCLEVLRKIGCTYEVNRNIL